MKTISIIIILFFTQTCASLYGQVKTENSDSLTQLLKGNWYLVNSYPLTQDSLVFHRQSSAPNNWGDRIEFYENGEFVDAYSAKCGNDTKIHNEKGNWTLDKSKIITTSIPVCLGHLKHKILRLTADTLVLQMIE